jgi:hypothetical protein
MVARVPRDSDPRMTALAKDSRNCNWQNRPLVRERATHQQTRNCLTIIKIWSWTPDGSFFTRQTGWIYVGRNIRLKLRPNRTLRTPRTLCTLCSLYEQCDWPHRVPYLAVCVAAASDSDSDIASSSEAQGSEELVADLLRELQFSRSESLLLEDGSWGRGHFGIPEVEERPPLEAVIRQRLECIADWEDLMRVVVNCRVCEWCNSYLKLWVVCIHV